MVGMAVDTMVWSSEDNNMAKTTPDNMAHLFFCSISSFIYRKSKNCDIVPEGPLVTPNLFRFFKILYNKALEERRQKFLMKDISLQTFVV